MRTTGRVFVGGLVVLAWIASAPAMATDVCGPVCNVSWNLAGSPYVATCDVTVAAGCTIDIEAGVEVRFQAGTTLAVDGDLTATGTAGNLVTFTSDAGSPSPGDWDGLDVNAGGSATIDFAEIAYGQYGVRADAAAISIDDSLIRDSSSRGAWIDGGTLAMSGTDLIDNGSYGLYANGGVAFTIDTLAASGHSQSGLYFEEEASGTVDALSATSNFYGLRVFRSQNSATTVTITGSSLTGNTYGLYIQGQNNAIYVNPAVSITGSSLFGNSTADLYATNFFDPLASTISAGGNWWGTTDVAEIAANVHDRKDAVAAPAVDWCAYLDGPPPTGTLAHTANCPTLSVCSADESWTDTAEPYLLTSNVSVCAGRTLDIGSDVEVRGVEDSGIAVAGTLNVNGTPSNPATLTANAGSPARGDWDGLNLLAGSSATIVGAEIAWATYGIEATSATIDIDDSTIRESSTRGIWQKGGSLDLNDSDVTDNGGYGLYLTDDTTFTIDTANVSGHSTSGIYAEDESSGTVTGLNATSNFYGIYAYRSQTTATTVDVTDSSFTGNSYGVYVQGQNNAIYLNPVVSVTSSSLFDNSTSNFYTNAFLNPEDAVVSASGNWWGTTDPMQIGANIRDRKDSLTAPRVDWCSYLDGPPPTGAPAHSFNCPSLSTCGVTESWTDTANPYLLTSVKEICPTGTLEIGPGVEVRASDGAGFRVEGAIDINGTLGTPVTLTSAAAAPARGDWDGLTFLAGSTATIDGAEIDWATYGIEATDSTMTIVDTTIREASSRGIWQKGGMLDLDSSDLLDNGAYGLYATDLASFDLDTVTMNGHSSSGVYAEDESVGTIVGLDATSNFYGLYVYRSANSPTTVDVTGSSFTDNSYGVYVQGQNSAAFFNPQVTVSGSSIFDNSSFDFFATSFLNPQDESVDAGGNWWGTVDPSAIAANIHDRKNSLNAPAVDWCAYLDAPPSTGVTAHAFTCPDLITCDVTESWNDSSTPYLLTSIKNVCPTGTLEIGPGVEVRSVPDAAIRVEGTLDVNGTGPSPTRLTSAASVPARGDWDGLVFLDGANGTIDSAEIAWTVNGIDSNGATLTVDDSTISESSSRGIWLRGGMLDLGSSTITGSQSYGLYATDDATYTIDTVDILDSGTGIYADDESSGTITGLTASGNTYGIFAYRSQNTPTTVDVTASIFTANTYGVYVQGQNSAAFHNPVVDVSASSLFDNTSHDFYATAFVDARTTTVTAAGNWWGTTDATEIGANVHDRKNSIGAPAVDWCSYLDAPPPAGVLAHGKICPALSICGGSESWNTTSDPYLLGSLATVCSGDTLEIGADVEVRAVGHAGFDVEGTLDTLGTESNPVILTADSATPARGGWDGLTYLDGSDGSLSHTEIVWPAIGIDATEATVSIDGTTIREASSRAVLLSGGSFDATDSTFRDNTSYGLYADDDATFDLDSVTIFDSGTGIYAQGEASGTATRLDASGNTYGIFLYRSTGSPTTMDVAESRLTQNTYGVYVQGQNSAAFLNPQLTLTTSSLYDNSSHALYTTNFFDAANSLVTAPDNWWGDDQVDAIAAAIFDREDSVNSPRVLTRPFGSGCDPALGRDADGDSLGDFEDNCPVTFNQAQVDGDGDGMGDDCDPEPGTLPGAACNGIDDVTDGYADADGDGWGDPCDFHPTRADAYPGATEVCDGRDNDGDGVFAAGELVDADGDGAVDCLDGFGDCNDANAAVYPCNCERCNNLVDDDCDAATDGADLDCPLNTYCVILSGTNPIELDVSRGACSGANAASSADLIRGSTTNLGISGGSIDLGNVACVSGALALDRATDMSEDGNPNCNEGSVFWLAKPTGAGDFGTSWDGLPRDVSNPDPVCP